MARPKQKKELKRSRKATIMYTVEKSDLPQINTIVDKNVEIKCLDGRIGAIAEECRQIERNRGWSR
jgi:hypothetical protein